MSSFHQTSHIKETGQTEAVFVMWIFQALAAIIIIGIAFLYGMFMKTFICSFRSIIIFFFDACAGGN